MRLSLCVVLFAACRPSPPVGMSPEPVEPPPVVAPAPIGLEASPCEPDAGLREDLDAGAVGRIAHGCANDGRLDEARTLADLAIAKDESSPEANYAMARILLAMRQIDGNGCEREAYLSEVLDRTLKASVDPSLRAAMVTQDLFAEARPALRYRIATGVDVASAQPEQLYGVRFYTLGNGAFGSQGKLLLGPNGTATLSTLTFTDAGDPTWVESAGTWSLDGPVLVLDGARYPLRADGVLDDGEGDLPDWLDVMSECEA